MPMDCWGYYVNVGVLEIDDDCDPSGIYGLHARYKGVRKVVEIAGGVHYGKGSMRSEWGRTVQEFKERYPEAEVISR